MMTPLTEVEMEALMVAVVDGVASPTQRERLSTYLRDHPELARELEDHMALKALTDGWVSRLEVDLIETRHQEQPLTRREAGIAGVLFVTGLSVLTGFGAAELLVSEAPLWVRAGYGMMAAGGLVAALSVLRWKLKTWNRDPYTEVIR